MLQYIIPNPQLSYKIWQGTTLQWSRILHSGGRTIDMSAICAAENWEHPTGALLYGCPVSYKMYCKRKDYAKYDGDL